MRSTVSVLTVAAVALAACSGATEPEAGPSEPSESVTVEETVAPTESVTDTESEDDVVVAESLRGEDVCTALLPALDGEIEGLDPYATAEVLATLDQGESSDPVAPLAEVYADGDASCEIAIGDSWATVTLEDADHGGQRASSAVWETSYPETEPADPVAVAEAVASIRETDAVCDGQAADLPEGAGDHVIYELPAGTVVAVVCDTFAYQSSYDLRGWDGASLTTLTVEQWRDGVEYSPIILGSPSVDGGQLTNLEKARGLGDCGVFSTWFFDGDFLGLAAVRERSCDDQAEYVEPDQWAPVYPAH